MTEETTQASETPVATEAQSIPPPPPPTQMNAMSEAEIGEGKLFAVIAYLGLIGFLIALLTKKDNRFALYHIKQSLVLVIAYFVAAIVPFLGWFLVGPLLTILLIIGIINAASGVEKPLPIIGKFAEKFNF